MRLRDFGICLSLGTGVYRVYNIVLDLLLTYIMNLRRAALLKTLRQ